MLQGPVYTEDQINNGAYKLTDPYLGELVVDRAVRRKIQDTLAAAKKKGMNLPQVFATVSHFWED